MAEAISNADSAVRLDPIALITALTCPSAHDALAGVLVSARTTA